MADKTQPKFDYDYRWQVAGEVLADKTPIKGADSPVWEHVPEKVRESVLAGTILASVGFVTASADVDDNGKKVTRKAITSYVRLEADDAKAALTLMDGRIKATDEGAGVLTRFNYGYDLDSRGEVRTGLLQKIEGPDKAIERAVKAMAQLPGWSEERARKFIAANPDALAAALEAK